MPKPKQIAAKQTVVKPSQRESYTQDELIRDPRSYGNPYAATQPAQPVQDTSNDEKRFSPVDTLVGIATGGMNKDERNAAASRERAAVSYQDEQDALLEAAKARRQKENEESYARRREEEKRLNELGKKAKEAYAPNAEQEEFAEDARRYAEAEKRKEAREAIATGSDNKTAVPATPFRADKPEDAKPAEKPQSDEWFPTPDSAAEGQRLAEEETAGRPYTEWDGRKELLRELDELEQNAGYITDPFEANRAEERRNEILEQLYAGDRAAGNEPQHYGGAAARGREVLGGASNQYLGGMVNAAGTALDAAYAAVDTNEYAGWATDPLSAETIGYEHDESKMGDMAFVKRGAGRLEAAADSLGEAASTDLARAKTGLGTLGTAGVDIAVNMIQMGYDAALGAVPGFSALGAMFARTFGSSAQEARQQGASIDQQVVYGLAKAGIEVATEKMFDGVAGIYGKGSADEVVDGVIRRLARTPTGMTALRFLASAVEEGGEEVVSDIFAPLAETIINDETLYSLFFDENGRPLQGSYSLNGSEVLYDFLIGAVIGSLGGAASIATGESAAKNAEAMEANDVEARVRAQTEGVMEALAGRSAPAEEAGQEAETGAAEEAMAERQTSGEERAEEKAPEAPKTPGEVLAEAATPKAEEARRTEGEERAEEKAPEAPAELPEKTKGPDEILAEEASKNGKPVEGLIEAAESPEADTHESVPPTGQKSSSEAPAELNSGLNQNEDSGRIQRDIDEGLDSIYNPDSPNYGKLTGETRREKLWPALDKQYEERKAKAGAEGKSLPATDDYKGRSDLIDHDIADLVDSLLDGSADDAAASELISRLVNEQEELELRAAIRTQDETDGNGGHKNEQSEVSGNLKSSQARTESEANARTSDNVGVYARAKGRAYFDQQTAKQDAGEVNTQKTNYSVSPAPRSHVGDLLSRRDFGDKATYRSANNSAEQKAAEVLGRVARGNVKIGVVENADTATWGLTYVDEAGNVTSLLRNGKTLDDTGLRGTAAHEGVHANFILSVGVENADSLAGHLLKQFIAENPGRKAQISAFKKILTSYKINAAKLWSKFQSNKTLSQYVDDFLSNETIAFIASGSYVVRKGDPAKLDAIQAELRQFLADTGQFDADAFADAPTISETAKAVAEKEANGNPQSSGSAANPAIGGEVNDPGANKSNRDSLFVNDPGEQEQTGELPGDDMTPLNDISREQDEQRREQQKAEAKKRFGKENYERLSKALEELDAFEKDYTDEFGDVERDEHGGIVEDEDGNPVKNSVPKEFAARVRSMLDGEETVQSFAEYYNGLRPSEGENKGTDENYLYDGALAEALNQFANAERDLIYAEKGGPANAEKATQFGEGMSPDTAKENYAKASEAFSLVFQTRTKRLADIFHDRVSANEEITRNAKDETEGLKNAFERLGKKFWQMQMRPDTFFKALGGFYEKTSKVMYSLAKRAGDSLKTKTNVRNNAFEIFRDVTTNEETAKAWKDIESGKTKSRVKVPGLNGGISMNTAIALLKTLYTKGSLDHIARFGAQFVNEHDFHKGLNNNGRGDTEGYQAKNRLTREALDQIATDNLEDAGEKLTGENIYNEKIRILEELRSELMAEVSSNKAALAAFNASTNCMQYLAKELNGVTLRLYGLAKALQGSDYWPMQVIGRGNNLQYVNNRAFQMEDASYLQHRKGGSGALFISPFTETMSSYINRASNFCGFGELNSDLQMMSKEIGVGRGATQEKKQSLQSTIKKQAGNSAADWMTRYMETLNGTAKKPSAIGSWLRSNLASSSLTLNPGVALKQSPSYYNAAGIIDLDILMKNRLVHAGPLRTAKSWEKDPLLQSVNERTGILTSRKSGTVALGESERAGKELFGNLKKRLPPWITNRDVSTVSNLAMACADQIKRRNPGIDESSDEFYQKTAELLEEAVIKTQPIYDPEFRPDYLRSSNELVRAFVMFRTQHSQNLNQLMQAFGEANAAKKHGTEAEQKAANRNVRQVVSGYAMSQMAFAVLGSAAKLLLHKRKDYEDEEGNLDFGKIAKRVGIDFAMNSFGVVWFGDTVAKVALDVATNAATGGKGTSEFYKLADNTISTVDSLVSSAIQLAKNPSVKTGKGVAFDISQAAGLPLRNAYNMLNSLVMYGLDAAGKNPGSYDDIVDMVDAEAKMSDTARAKRTTEAAIRSITSGDAKRAEALLATLNYGDKSVVSAVKKAAGDAYVIGDINEKTYRKILADTATAVSEAEVAAAEAAYAAKEIDAKTYSGILRNAGKIDQADIDKTVHGKELDKTIAALTERDPEKYEALIKSIDDAKGSALPGTSGSEAAARLILDAAMGKNGQAAFMEKYTSASYFKAYDAASAGFPAEKIVDMLAAIDEDKDDKFTQGELYDYFKETGRSEIVRAVWRANGWSTSFEDYCKSRAKTSEYDKVKSANESYEFSKAEEVLKGLQGDARITFQKADNDPAMFKAIAEMGLSDTDTDTVVQKYVSPKSRANYSTVRSAGYSPSEAMDFLVAVDADGKGTVSQDEMWSYYKAHTSDEAIIKALYDSQGYTGKNTKDWETYKRTHK